MQEGLHVHLNQWLLVEVKGLKLSGSNGTKRKVPKAFCKTFVTVLKISLFRFLLFHINMYKIDVGFVFVVHKLEDIYIYLRIKTTFLWLGCVVGKGIKVVGLYNKSWCFP